MRELTQRLTERYAVPRTLLAEAGLEARIGTRRHPVRRAWLAEAVGQARETGEVVPLEGAARDEAAALLGVHFEQVIAVRWAPATPREEARRQVATADAATARADGSLLASLRTLEARLERAQADGAQTSIDVQFEGWNHAYRVTVRISDARRLVPPDLTAYALLLEDGPPDYEIAAEHVPGATWAALVRAEDLPRLPGDARPTALQAVRAWVAQLHMAEVAERNRREAEQLLAGWRALEARRQQLEAIAAIGGMGLTAEQATVAFRRFYDVLAGYTAGEDSFTDEAEARAAALLERHLSPAQFESWRRHRRFQVLAPSGRGYTVEAGRVANVTRDDGLRLCAVAPGVPLGDHLLAQKLMIESDEAAFLGAAISHGRRLRAAGQVVVR